MSFLCIKEVEFIGLQGNTIASTIKCMTYNNSKVHIFLIFICSVLHFFCVRLKEKISRVHEIRNGNIHLKQINMLCMS